MINIKKSTPPPACLENEKEKASGNYRCGDVLERTRKDFLNKCYICELGFPTTVNVEHFVPHKGDKNLKFDWNNLFWSCGHCNNTKIDRYENILNCTNPEHDVMNWIEYELKPFPTTTIEVHAIPDQKNNPLVQNTVRLLKDVYNGTTTLKKLEAENLRTLLLNECTDFQEQLERYYNCEHEEDKALLYRIITKHLSKDSPFTAFKRWVIKQNPVFLRDFGNSFD